jgi:hypothetical protein
MRLVPFAVVTSLAVFGAGRAAAQDSAAADALFDAGLSEMKAGNYDSGCPKLAESQRLDPRPGTLFTLAECEAKGDKLATAYVHYEDYLRVFSRMAAKEQKAQRGRDAVAKAALERIGPEIPKLTLKLPDGAPADLVVIRNGTRLGTATFGVALPVDPGEQVVVVELSDGSRGEQRITLAKGEKRELVLELPAKPAAPESAPAAANPETRAVEVSSGGGSNTLAYVLGGVGIAGIAVGSVTGVMVLGKKSTIDDHCNGSKCDQQGLDAADSAKSLGLVSTIGFGVGVAGLAVATVLLVTGKSDDAAKDRAARFTPIVAGTPRGGYLGLGGRF